jgi:hypothetical protein
MQAPEGRGRSGMAKSETDSLNLLNGGIIMEQIVTLIQTVGFPIACAVAMFIMLNNEQKKFMKQMKNFPSVLRTQYVHALLCENDTAKAENIKMQFENIAKTYPYPNDVQAERELMMNVK